MGDLISRSKLLKDIETWGGCVEALHEYIENMPTAYDIDKVVEELEKIEQHCLDISDWQGQSAICDAIEIVKKGGMSDDVCRKNIKVVE